MWINFVAGLIFMALIPVSLISGLKQSVPFLVFLSLWALVAVNWSGGLAALAADKAEQNGS